MKEIDFEIIYRKLESIEQMFSEQISLTKEVLSFEEAAVLLDISKSHLYKLTSQKEIPHFCPGGKRLYFNRKELIDWMQKDRQC